MKILFIANLVPYPLDGGGKIFTFSVLKALSQKHDIDLLCFYENEKIEEAKCQLNPFCNSIYAVPIKVTTKENMKLILIKAGLSLFSKKPLSINKYHSKKMVKILTEKVKNNRYDCVFFNLLSMYSYAPIIKSLDSDIKTILYEQNCETLIYKRYLKESTNFLKKIFLNIEVKKLENFEQKSIRDVNQLILLSEEDRKALDIDKSSCNIIPIGVQKSQYSKKYNDILKEPLRLLFIGTMTWGPNNDGIIWFLENVMPMCDDSSKYELYIIGKHPSEAVQNLCKKYKNVKLLGFVESLDKYYDLCDVLIVPLFIGSGQRVKIIEAFSKSFAVISTSIGAEGLNYIDGKNILIANNENEFKIKIDKCFDSNLLSKIGCEGNKVFEKEYSEDIIAKKINDILL